MVSCRQPARCGPRCARPVSILGFRLSYRQSACLFLAALSEDLAKLEQTYPGHRPIVLVGHSMGGLLSQMQVTTITRADWVRALGKASDGFAGRSPPDSFIHRALIFDANPRIHRVVFICTPHRGSNMAIQGIGQLAMRLIALPSSLISQFNNEVKAKSAPLLETANAFPTLSSAFRRRIPCFTSWTKCRSLALTTPSSATAAKAIRRTAPTGLCRIGVRIWMARNLN